MFRIYALLSLLVLAIGCGNYPKTQEKASKNQRSKGPSANVSSAGTETSSSTTTSTTSTTTPTTTTAPPETEDSESEDENPVDENPAFAWQELGLVDQGNKKILNPNDIKQFIMSGDKKNIYLVTTKGLFYAVATRRPFLQKVNLSMNKVSLDTSDAKESGFQIKPTETGLVVLDKSQQKLFIVQGQDTKWAENYYSVFPGKGYTIKDFFVNSDNGTEYVIFPSNRGYDGNKVFYRPTSSNWDVATGESKNIEDVKFSKPNPEKHQPSTAPINPAAEDSTQFEAINTVKSYYQDDQNHFWVFVNGKGLFLRGQNL